MATSCQLLDALSLQASVSHVLLSYLGYNLEYRRLNSAPDRTS